MRMNKWWQTFFCELWTFWWVAARRPKVFYLIKLILFMLQVFLSCQASWVSHSRCHSLTPITRDMQTWECYWCSVLCALCCVTFSMRVSDLRLHEWQRPLAMHKSWTKLRYADDVQCNRASESTDSFISDYLIPLSSHWHRSSLFLDIHHCFLFLLQIRCPSVPVLDLGNVEQPLQMSGFPEVLYL